MKDCIFFKPANSEDINKLKVKYYNYFCENHLINYTHKTVAKSM